MQPTCNTAHQAVNRLWILQWKVFLPVWEEATTSFHAILIHHSPLKQFRKFECFGKINKWMNNRAVTQMKFANFTLKSIDTIWFIPVRLWTWVPQAKQRERSLLHTHSLPGSRMDTSLNNRDAEEFCWQAPTGAQTWLCVGVLERF